jgi:hypothetical protein
LLSFGVASGQNALAPTATLVADPATIVDAQPNYVMQQPPAREIPFRPTMGSSAYEAAKARANSYAPGTRKPFIAPFPASVDQTIKVTNFNGHSSTEGLRPPDTHGAVGTTHFVEITNSHIDMYKRGTPPGSDPATLGLVKSVTLATFFGYTTTGIFDPRVVYDSTWNRWIVTADSFAVDSTHQYFFIAVSTSSDPTKPFYVYPGLNVTIFSGDFWDYPQLGIDQDAVLFTANIFHGAAYHGADFFAVAKARLNNGLGFSVPVFTGLAGTLAPPIVLDQNGSTFLLAAPPSGSMLTMYTATNTSHPFGTPSIALASSPITVASYGVPPSAHQYRPGDPTETDPDLLDTLDARFVNASTQNGVDLWQTHTVALGSFPGPYFYRIDTSTLAVTQSGFYFASGSSDDFNASIAANTAGDCFVTWTATDKLPGTPTNAEVRLSGKLSATPGIPAGLSAFNTLTTNWYDASTDTTERWGDYSAVTVDPLNGSLGTDNAWLVNETVKSPPLHLLWGSRIVKFGLP